MGKTINRVAVIGSGVMGSGIAALLAGVSCRVHLLDIVPQANASDASQDTARPEYRNMLAMKAMAGMKKSGALYTDAHLGYITPGNTEDDLGVVAECDWVVEVVTENLEVKRALMKRVDALRKPGCVVSTNTSGVSVNAIAEGLSEDFRQCFLGLHFFNPVRVMRLLELIPCRDTNPGVIGEMTRFCADALGKVVINAKDTPNFIANRIGGFALIDALSQMFANGLSPSALDDITGAALGRPRSGTCKTVDMVGLDILSAVSGTILGQTEDAAEKEAYALPAQVQRMIEEGCLGNKTQKGFYEKKAEGGKKQFLERDFESGSYAPIAEINNAVTAQALKSENKYKQMVWGELPENRIAWQLTKNVLLYSARLSEEITDDWKNIDLSMVYGYNWEQGPFAIWDAIGLAESVARMQEEGESVPGWVLKRANEGEAFYDAPPQYGFAHCAPLRRGASSAALCRETDASLYDIGDAVLCLAIHSKGNALTESAIGLLEKALRELETKRWNGMVICGEGKLFSAGASLDMIGGHVEKKDWQGLAACVDRFHRCTQGVKYARVPVVAAAHGMALGGGAELLMHSAAVILHAETRVGLVETGVGLIPGAGGCKESLAIMNECAGAPIDETAALKQAWRRIAFAARSSGAHDAIAQGMLRPASRVVMNPDVLLDEAKRRVLRLAEDGYSPPPPARIKVLGAFGRSMLELEAENLLGGGFMSAYDRHIANKLAFVLTGGDIPGKSVVSEEYMIELETEAFVSLCGEEKTAERIRHMLATGKPLRN